MPGINTGHLLKVKTIAPKMVKQIQTVQYDTKEGSLYLRLREALTKEEVKPIGWVPGMVLGCSDMVSFWLVRFENRYWWFMCPSGGALWDKYKDDQTIEQLFV